MLTIAEILSQELGQKLQYIENVIALIDEGNTIPFIARYRKEMHGAMDDTVLRTLETRLQYLRNLMQRKEEIRNAIESQGKLTEELAAAIGKTGQYISNIEKGKNNAPPKDTDIDALIQKLELDSEDAKEFRVKAAILICSVIFFYNRSATRITKTHENTSF